MADSDDPLLACLEFVATELGRPFSRKAAVNGLPLRGGRLTADLVARAAESQGLAARLVRRDIRKIPSLVYPFIVLFENGDACVVLKRRLGNRVTVVFPNISPARRSKSLRSLTKDASGYVFYVTSEDAESLGREAATQEPRADGHWFWSAVWRFWPSWLQIVFAAFLINILGLALPIFVMNVYDRVIPNLAIPTLWALAAGVVLALFLDFCLKQLRAIVLDQTGRRVDMKVAAALFQQALGLSMAERTESSGSLANKVREFETVRDFFTSSSIIAVTDFLFIGIFIFILWLIVGPIAYVPLVAVPLVLGATLLIQLPLARSVAKAHANASGRHSILVESLMGIESIKAASAEGVMQRRWEDAVAATVRANSSTRFWSGFALYFTTMVQQSVSVVTIVWGVFLVAEGTITIGALIAANILAARVLAPLGNIAMTLARAQQAFVAMRGLNALMKLPREHHHENVEDRSIERGEVEFRDVTFAYPGSKENALSDITFHIGAGEHVGMVGRIGSGKTSVGRLLAAFYQPDRGTVLIDGINARRYEISELRAGVGFVPQEPELFAGTLRENIILGKPTASEREIAEACRISGVDAFTASHPLGLNRPVGERGRGLSGGQRQAIALARMLLRRPRVLFLDEPSSAMDNATENALKGCLREFARDGCTMIICSHRMSLLELADRLLVFDAGKLVADGPKPAVIKALQTGEGGDGERPVRKVAP